MQRQRQRRDLVCVAPTCMPQQANCSHASEGKPRLLLTRAILARSPDEASG